MRTFVKWTVGFFCVALIAWSGTGQAQIVATERAALEDFYNSTNGPAWCVPPPAGACTWMGPPGSECSWNGVWCSADGLHVVKLWIAWSSQLNGPIPPTIGDLTELEYLWLDHLPGLTGTIPEEIGSLSKLRELILSNAHIEGTIPDSIGNLSSLEVLKLNWLDLEGPIPDTVANLQNLRWFAARENRTPGIPYPYGLQEPVGGMDVFAGLAKLEWLDLALNRLSGDLAWLDNAQALTNLRLLGLNANYLTGEIPDGIANLTNLEALYLNDNSLTGDLYRNDVSGTSWFDALTKLEDLRLYANHLSGSIPVEVAGLTNLIGLLLHGNHFTGAIPDLGTLHNLKSLYIGQNPLTGTLFRADGTSWLGDLVQLEYLNIRSSYISGAIPPEIRQLNRLVEIDFTNSDFSGQIPIELTELSNLARLYLGGNQLTGELSEGLAQMSSLTHLFLDSNQFTGELPEELTQMSSLTHLYLDFNQLTGPVPAWLGSMPTLKRLSLGSNQLSGSIPPEIGDLVQLERLILNSNDLDGPIPPNLGSLSSLTDLVLHDNRLSGAVPPDIGSMANLRRATLYGNMLSGEIPHNMTQLQLLYYHPWLLFWNAMHTTDPEVLDFLDAFSPGWQSTQTVAPADVAVGEVTADSVEVTWTPILYTGDQGGYRVLVSESGGPYTEAGMTANKLASSFVVPGLDDGTTYLFVVQSVTFPHASNKNTVESDYSWEVSATTISLNEPPVVAAGPDQTAGEGTQASFLGEFTDPDEGDTHTIHWDFGDGDTATGTLTPQHPYADDGVYTVTLTVTDDSGESGSDSLTVTVSNLAPAVGPITAPVDPVQAGTSIAAEASFTDAGILDTHTAVWNWGDDSTSAGAVSESGGSGLVTGEHPYSIPGVYTLTLTVADNDGGSGTALYQYVVVYDPDGGFVTGGGWIDSPAGAYAADPSLTGKANFGFVSKYKKGTTVPTGETEFRFRAADLDFHSTSYQWLVVAGARAMYKGDGQINGEGIYGFMLSAIDGALPGGGGSDKFRIKIWDKATDVIVYDNQIGEDEDADPTTVLGGGSIVIHN